jgi:predicted N-formylglutamate amidohydrolase
VVSCEHAGNDVPAGFENLFIDAFDALHTHRGYDPGTEVLGQYISAALNAPLISTRVTRLLVDCNRSLGHRQLFSCWSKALGPVQRQDVLDRFYHPHRQRVESAIDSFLIGERNPSRVVHLGVHSFTPILDEKPRLLDVGLLYDPGRKFEREFCQRWKAELERNDARCRVRRNQPYLGKTDGLTTFLRHRFREENYAGIELEVNQGIVLAGGERWLELKTVIVESLRTCLGILQTV